MIASVSAWIKDIIFVVLFATFMELLLPSNSMQRFIRVIMGLLIMLAILNPALNIIESYLSSGQELSTAAATTLNNSTVNSNVITPITEERDRLSYELYKKELAKQIRAVVTTIDGVADARISVEVNSVNDKPAGSIKKVIVYIQPGLASSSRNILPVAPIKIGDEKRNESKELMPQLVNKIQHAIAELYQIPPNHIDVQLLY